VEKRGNRRPTTHISYSVLFFPDLDTVARLLSYLFQFHLVIPKLGNCKNKYVQLSSHIMGISKEQRTSFPYWFEKKEIISGVCS